MKLDKQAVIRAVRVHFEAEIAEATRVAREAAEAATHEENRAEGDKDMRSTEASYVAHGQAERVRTREAALASIVSMPLRAFDGDTPVGVSALVELHSEGGGTGRELYLLVPAGGGVRVKVGRAEVQTLTVQSPLGRALLGRLEGDEVEIATARGKRSAEIVSVA